MVHVHEGGTTSRVRRSHPGGYERSSYPEGPYHGRRTADPGFKMIQSSSESTYGLPIFEYGNAEGHLRDDYYARNLYVPTSVPSPSIPSMTVFRELEEEVQDTRFLATPPERKVAAPRISGLPTNQQPGWVV